MVEIVATAEFAGWYQGLSEGDAEQVTLHVEILQVRGVALAFPQSSSIKGSRIALRELRLQSSGHPLRVFYAFDPKRQAVLLVGGDKAGNEKFYEEMIPLSERLFAAFLKETGQNKPKK